MGLTDEEREEIDRENEEARIRRNIRAAIREVVTEIEENIDEREVLEGCTPRFREAARENIERALFRFAEAIRGD